jgi:hypothetical protein
MFYLFVSGKHEGVIGAHVDIQFNVTSAWIVNCDCHVHRLSNVTVGWKFDLNSQWDAPGFHFR